MICLISVLTWGLAVTNAELQIAQMLKGGQVNLGPYNAVVDIGVLPDRDMYMSPQDKKASYSLRRLLELQRGSFPTGINGLPSLDPYVSNNLAPISLNVPFLSGKVDVAQVIIKGLQTFHLNQMEVQWKNLRTDFALKVPLLSAVVSFRANMALGVLFPFNVDGTLRVILENVRIGGALGVVENRFPERCFYSTSSLHAIFRADNVKVSVDGLNLDNDTLELLLSDSAEQSGGLEPAMKSINYYVAQQVMRQLDDILQKFSSDQIKAYLLAR